MQYLKVIRTILSGHKSNDIGAAVISINYNVLADNGIITAAIWEN